MRLFKVPALLYYIFNRFTWSIPVTDKSVFLTFDDGPTTELCPYILDTLDKYGAKATFFCVGENVAKNPEIFKMIIERGHKVGNHTYSHEDARDVSHSTFISSINKCNELVKSRLFRPPYGRIKPRLAKKIKRAGYKPIMWSVLSYDFDMEISAGFILRKIVNQTKPGSIVVFHDNLKAKRNLQIVLPRYLAFFKNKGYKFKTIPEKSV